MSKKPIEQLLVEIDNFSREKRVSKKEVARKLNMPYSTFGKWFQKGKGKRYPSPKYVKKIERFLES